VGRDQLIINEPRRAGKRRRALTRIIETARRRSRADLRLWVNWIREVTGAIEQVIAEKREGKHREG